MERDQQVARDYGYDLAHEEIADVTVPGDTTGHAAGDPHGSASPAGGQDELSEDLGYDEAHGF